MLEVALLAVASVLALAAAAFAARTADDARAAETVRGTKHLRDDAIVASATSLLLFGAMAAMHRRAGALTFAAWSGGACAAGALASMCARAWRDRATTSPNAGAVGEQVIVVAALGALTALAASAAHAIADPQHLATQVPEMVVSFTVGCAVLEMGELALPSAAAMVLASYFFDANAGMLRSAPSHASALGFVLFPLAACALGALGSAIAVLIRRPQVAAALALPAAAAAALAMLGWLWQPFALCGAIGASMTLTPKLVTSKRAREAVALGSLGAAAIASFAVAKHVGLVHAGFFGIAVAAVSAQSAALVARASAGASHELVDAGGEDGDALADRQASALGALALALAVLDGAALFRCTRFADAGHAPTDDIAVMLAHCTLADVTPTRIDVSHPVTLACAIFGIAVCVVVRPAAALRGRILTMTAVVASLVVATAVAHLGFGIGLEAIAAATLASSLAAALFPEVCSRTIAQTIAACALALVAVVG
jgi:hypothetical protein